MSKPQELCFTPFKLGDIAVSNRFAVAPMTRARAPSRVPSDSMIKYYQQRAGAGLIITEATQLSQQFWLFIYHVRFATKLSVIYMYSSPSHC